jgi:flagellar hook-associated protein 2
MNMASRASPARRCRCKHMASNALTAFGAGSGLDSRAIVDGIITAERTARAEPINRRIETLGARISALGQLRSALTGIATSLDGRVRSGELGLALGSSDAAVAVERLGGGPAAAVFNEVSVTRLAAGQRLNGPALTGADAAVGLGTLSFVFGTRTAIDGGGFSFAAGAQPSVNVTITAENNSLSGLVQAINAAGGGLSASIITTAGASRLVVRGPEGAAAGFIVSAAPDGVGLERFNHTPGAEAMTLGQAAGDAELSIDGIAVTRSSNRIDDLIAGARLTLTKPASGVAITASRSTAAVSGALADFVGTLQAMRQLIGDFRRPARDGDEPGPLANDPTARALDQRITRLVSFAVPQANGLSLAQLGVGIARDGTITVDAARLANLPPTRLADAESLLRELSGASNPTRPNRLQSIAQLAITASDGLTRQRGLASRDLDKVQRQADVRQVLLTRQFAAMERAVGESRAVGAQLQQLVDSWTRSRD